MKTQFDETLLQDLDSFINYYEFIDVEKVYTNGSKLIQVSRIKQWFDYNNKQKELEVEKNELKDRIDKAIEYIENDMPYLEEPDEEFERCDGTTYMTMKKYDASDLLNILKGSEE